MANIKSQIKRIRTNEEAHQRNKAAKSAIRTQIKKVKLAAAANDAAKVAEEAKKAYCLIDKSVSDNVQHANTAARQKSTVARLVNSVK